MCQLAQAKFSQKGKTFQTKKFGLILWKKDYGQKRDKIVRTKQPGQNSQNKTVCRNYSEVIIPDQLVWKNQSRQNSLEKQFGQNCQDKNVKNSCQTFF